MSTTELIQEDSYHIVQMHEAGVFNPHTLAQFNDCLDVAFADENINVLYIRGEDKNFSQGLDLATLKSFSTEEFGHFVEDCMRMVGRMLSSPIPIVAIVNGHAFGLGVMVALACDVRLMRADRGYFCLPEIDIKMPFIASMMALITEKLPSETQRDLILGGQRIGGTDAKALGVMDDAVAIDGMLAASEPLVAPLLGKDRKTFSLIKKGINRQILRHI